MKEDISKGKYHSSLFGKSFQTDSNFFNFKGSLRPMSSQYSYIQITSCCSLICFCRSSSSLLLIGMLCSISAATANAAATAASLLEDDDDDDDDVGCGGVGSHLLFLFLFWGPPLVLVSLLSLFMLFCTLSPLKHLTRFL